MDILAAYLFLINAAAFLLMLADKRRAVKKAWRVPEATLLCAAAAGGSLGALFGMHVFRHKTRKPAFFLGIPVLAVIQILLVLWLYTKAA